MSCTFFFLCFAVGEEEVWIEARYWEWEALTNNRYHHLNHYAIFGSGYKGGAIKIMRSLLKKYGD